MFTEVRTPAAGSAPSSRDRRHPRLHTTPVPRVVAAAVRHLISTTIALDDGDAGRSDGDAVLIDLEVDGYRCVVTRSVIDLVRDPMPEPDPPDEVASTPLSPREHEVAQMVCAGLTNRAIASILDISPWTVGTHLRRIFGKFDVTSRAAMVTRFLREPVAAEPDR